MPDDRVFSSSRPQTRKNSIIQPGTYKLLGLEYEKTRSSSRKRAVDPCGPASLKLLYKLEGGLGGGGPVRSAAVVPETYLLVWFSVFLIVKAANISKYLSNSTFTINGTNAIGMFGAIPPVTTHTSFVVGFAWMAPMVPMPLVPLVPCHR